MVRWVVLGALCGALAWAQEPKLKTRGEPQKTPPPAQEQEPPEENESLKEKEYSYNPLQAQKEFTTGAYHYKTGKYKAAAYRFREATRWDPSNAEAFFRLGQAADKMKDKVTAKAAYAKYLELSPDGKEAAAVKKRLAGL